MARVSKSEVERILKTGQRRAIRADWQSHQSIRKRLGKKKHLKLYRLILEAQGGKCAICGNEASHYDRRFSIDHCHKTGRVRGVLCASCNPKLTFVEEHQDKIAEYLENDVNWLLEKI